MGKYRDGDELKPLGRTAAQWKQWAQACGLRSFHGAQVFDWLHRKRELDPEAMTNLSKHARGLLAVELETAVPRVVAVREAQDGTRKVVLALRDDSLIESVLIPMDEAQEDVEADAGEDEAVTAAEPDAQGGGDLPTHRSTPRSVRVTQCVSTQVGCAMGCEFCASGASGLHRHLDPDEILAQVLVAHRYLRPSERLTNVVFMGMGEPLHNYDATVHAVRLLQYPGGLGLSSRRITISTVGLIPELERLGAEFQGHIGLAVSLHAADDETRSRIVPINRRYPLSALMQTLRGYPLPPRRRITIEYALIDGVNDSVAMAKQLAKLLRGVAAKVNLIPVNAVAHGAWRPSPEQRVKQFQRELNNLNVSCFIRRSRGDSISAACGQLARQCRDVASGPRAQANG